MNTERVNVLSLPNDAIGIIVDCLFDCDIKNLAMSNKQLYSTIFNYIKEKLHIGKTMPVQPDFDLDKFSQEFDFSRSARREHVDKLFCITILKKLGQIEYLKEIVAEYVHDPNYLNFLWKCVNTLRWQRY